MGNRKLAILWAYLRHPAVVAMLTFWVILPAALAVYEGVYRSSRQAELITFMELARGASSRDEVERIFMRMNSRILTLDRMNDTRWRVVPPIEFTANHWILYLDFADGQLTRMWMRTTDGWHDHPDKAPPDVLIGNSR